MPYTTKARITNKSELRSFSKNGRLSYVFSIDLVDKHGYEMAAVFFGEAAEHFHPLLREDQVYVIQDNNVKVITGKYHKE